MARRILIIEDNATNLELMVYLLQEFDYIPITAPDGETGLEMIKRERPDLILCDIQMPMLDGYELARRVKADPALRAIPVVAVTAMAMVGDRERGLAAGFDGYISKPLDAKSFIAQVEAFLGIVKNPRPTPPATANPATRPANKGLVLAVDDLSANTKLLQGLLEPSGYTVMTTSGMTDAMALARQHKPDLIISDIQMHEGSGYELCEAVKTDHRLRHIPVILITSTYCDEAARTKGLALGATHFIFRPIESLALLSLIESCLARRK